MRAGSSEIRNPKIPTMQTEHKILFEEVVVTSAQLKALVATDVDIVAAPGAGKVIVPLFSTLTLLFNETAYAWANTDHAITLGSATTDSDAEAQALIESVDNHTIVMRPAADSAELATNTALKLGASGTGEPTTGDSTLLVKVAYYVIDVTE